MPRFGRRLAAVVIAPTLLLVVAQPASAHVRKAFGPVLLSYGWADEPAFSGSANAVEVVVSSLQGVPVVDLGADGELSAEVSFGDQRIQLPLLSTPQPGDFRAPLLPTRAGTYTFHITGTVRGRAVDTTSVCGDTTFSCVADVAEIEFPAKDPSNGELAQRLVRALPRAEGARTTATTARDLAIAGLAVAVLALAAALFFGLRAKRG